MTEANPYGKFTPAEIESRYYATAAEVAKAHGIHATRISTALLAPEIHDGHAYQRRAILHPFIIYYDRRPVPKKVCGTIAEQSAATAKIIP